MRLTFNYSATSFDSAVILHMKTMASSHEGKAEQQSHATGLSHLWAACVSASKSMAALQSSTFSLGHTLQTKWQSSHFSTKSKTRLNQQCQDFNQCLRKPCVHYLAFTIQNEDFAIVKSRRKVKGLRFIIKIKCNIFLTQNFFYLRYACSFLIPW